jgi:hypothetical protein
MASKYPWFNAFRRAEVGSYVNDVATTWMTETSKQEFWRRAKDRSMEWLKSTTGFERFLLTEIPTAPFGPLGEGVQSWALAAMPKVAMSPLQTGVGKVLTAAAVVGAGVAAYRGLRSVFSTEYDEPPRYKQAYGRLHAMNNGGAFFGSGAKLDEIVGFGDAKMHKNSHNIGSNTYPLNPQAGGIPQALNRTANTHYLTGKAQHEFNSRLFNF